jgi:single-strand DNA-binding protein
MNELLAQLLRASQHRFIGRLGFEPEMKYLETGLVVCNARMLINQPGAKRDDGKKPDSFKLELWNKQAQAFADACAKGDLVEVSGRVKSDTWADRTTGEERSAWVVMVDDWKLLAKPGQGQSAPAQPAAPARQQAAAPAQSDWANSDSLPF